MAKIGIITFHFVNNYGGALQAYALYRTLADHCDVAPTIIDYRNRFIAFTDAVRVFPVTTKGKELLSGLSTMSLRRGRIRKFQQFMRENAVLTETYRSAQKLKVSPPDCDSFICGSDQIWNPVITGGVDKEYFLDFAPEGTKRIAYAPSFGLKSIPPKFEQEIKTLLSRIDFLSIREQSSVELVKQLTGKDADVLIDPTLLMEKEKWLALAKKPEVPQEYILVYIMQNDRSIYESVEKIKAETHLPVVAISRYGYQPHCVNQALVDVGPAEFLGLCANASMICTNSFHGLIFSLIFEKKLFLVPSKRFSGRMDNLLQLLGAEKEPIGDGEQMYSIRYAVDEVKQIVEREKEKSLRYLRDALR